MIGLQQKNFAMNEKLHLLAKVEYGSSYFAPVLLAPEKDVDDIGVSNDDEAIVADAKAPCSTSANSETFRKRAHEFHLWSISY